MDTGVYGRGTYMPCDWRAALWFGPVLFRVELHSLLVRYGIQAWGDPDTLHGRMKGEG